MIVALAGPIFSLLLAVFCALALWKTGKPVKEHASTTVGYVLEDSPAQRAGLKPNDTILKVNDVEVTCFRGNFHTGLSENIIFSEGEKIRLTILREGKTLVLECGFEIPETHFMKRKATRKIGIAPKEACIVHQTIHHSPAELAGLKQGDIIVSINGQPALSPSQIFYASAKGEPLNLVVENEGQQRTLSVMPIKPQAPHDQEFQIGIVFAPDRSVITDSLQYYTPVESISSAAQVMFTTLSKLISPQSDITVGHLSSPLGIGRTYFDLLQSDQALRWVLWFTLIFNVNLAIFNMMPFPVLDGGHVTLSLFEMIRGNSLKGTGAQILAHIQTSFALLLLGLMVYVLTKDIADLPIFGGTPKVPLSFAPPK